MEISEISMPVTSYSSTGRNMHNMFYDFKSSIENMIRNEMKVNNVSMAIVNVKNKASFLAIRKKKTRKIEKGFK